MSNMSKMFFYIDSMQMGGAQRVMANLCRYFSESGHEVVLINDIIPACGKPEYGIDGRVRRVYLDQGRDDTEKPSRYKKSVNRILQLRRLVKSENPALILSFLGPPNIRMLIATLGLKVKKYTSVRNDPYKEYGHGWRKAISNAVFCLADGCVFQTEDAKKYFPRVLQKKSVIIFNPVKDDFFKIEYQNCSNAIAVVGRLNAQKNPQLAIRAFARICSDYPDVSLILYGEGELRGELQELIDESGLNGRICLNGLETNISSKLAQATMFVMSSDYEGMPNALMEAMAAGVPSISTDCPCGGPKMLISNDENGLLVPCNDVNAMASAMRRLLNDKNLRERISKGAKKRAEDFSPEKIFLQWDSFLNP